MPLVSPALPLTKDNPFSIWQPPYVQYGMDDCTRSYVSTRMKTWKAAPGPVPVNVAPLDKPAAQ